jgi:hypothetical protein
LNNNGDQEDMDEIDFNNFTIDDLKEIEQKEGTHARNEVLNLYHEWLHVQRKQDKKIVRRKAK